MQTAVAIIGGGLAGVYAGHLLQAEGVEFRLVEARERLGGRILSADGFDLGPSWFWPHVQPQLASLVQALGLATFPQHDDGDVLFERMSRETPWRYRATHQQPQSMRLVGGTGSLIAALAATLPPEHVLLGTRATRMVRGESNVRLTVATAGGADDVLEAGQVIAAVPPRLLARVDLTPAPDAATLRRWRDTATWMAPHAKFVAAYDRPFWRAAGLSGTAQSFVGPLGEIHDATTAAGQPALFGFFSVGADARAAMGEAALADACLQQFARLFGAAALQPAATMIKDWAADALTASADDRSASAHPRPAAEPWVAGAWQDRLVLAASETSATEPGFMAGAIAAAQRAVADVLPRVA